MSDIVRMRKNLSPNTRMMFETYEAQNSALDLIRYPYDFQASDKLKNSINFKQEDVEKSIKKTKILLLELSTKKKNINILILEFLY